MKRIILLLIIPLFFGALYLTNPDKADFTSFIERAMDERASQIPSEYTIAMEELGIKTGQIASMASMLTKREDYLFCSTYDLNLQGHKLKFLGIATLFIPLETPDQIPTLE